VFITTYSDIKTAFYYNPFFKIYILIINYWVLHMVLIQLQTTQPVWCN